MNISYKDNPFLLFMQDKIEELLHNISVYAMDKENPEKMFIVIDGVSGCGKTNFVYEYLKEYLFSEGIIKKYQKKIDKISNHELSNALKNGITAEEALSDFFISCKDGILIIDDFTERDKNVKAVGDLIKTIHADPEYKNTVVILMGEFKNNMALLRKLRLDNLFNKRLRMSFYSPNFKQIASIFEIYANKKGGFSLSDKAKSTLIFYFSKIRMIKDTKEKLYKMRIGNASSNERNFLYTSEMFHIYKDIATFKESRDLNNKYIDQVDIFNTMSYKKMLSDLKLLEQYLPSDNR